MSLKTELLNFVNWMNEGVDDISLCPFAVQDYQNEVAASFKRQFLERNTEKGNGLRVSSLGKPAVLQALKLLGYDDNGSINNKLRYIFHLGDNFEAYILAMAKAYGFAVEAEQAEVTFEGVPGHIDAVFDTPSGQALIEVKTMSPNYFPKFAREPNDDRGYVTQAAVYSHCLGLPIYWLCINKGTGEVALIQPDTEALDKALARGRRIIPLLNEVKAPVDILALFKAPPAVEEKVKKVATGLFLMPESMKWSGYAPLFYQLYSEGYKTYVTGYNDSQTFVQKLEELNHATRTAA